MHASFVDITIMINTKKETTMYEYIFIYSCRNTQKKIKYAMKSMANQSDAFADPHYFPVELAIIFSCYRQLWDELAKMIFILYTLNLLTIFLEENLPIREKAKINLNLVEGFFSVTSDDNEVFHSNLTSKHFSSEALSNILCVMLYIQGGKQNNAVVYDMEVKRLGLMIFLVPVQLRIKINFLMPFGI